MILITGGAGFIGSNFVLQWISEEKNNIVNLDKLTWAGNLNNLTHLEHNPAHHFIRGDIRNRTLVHDLLRKFRPQAIVHCAAETHSERSQQNLEQFVPKNIMSTFELLEESLSYWQQLPPEEKQRFRFLHVSSHAVYGAAAQHLAAADENTPYAPLGLYAASKAASDHFVNAYHRTYGLPTLITHCSNNFGSYQFPKKLIPQIIITALQGKPLHIYGEGRNTRAWLHVNEHCAALRLVLARGIPGETYNIGPQAVITNKELIESVCRILDDLTHDSPFKPHASLIKFVKDNAKNQCYTLDCTKLKQLGWEPKEKFETSLRKTVHWYLQNMSWLENVISGDYKDWICAEYEAEEVPLKV